LEKVNPGFPAAGGPTADSGMTGGLSRLTFDRFRSGKAAPTDSDVLSLDFAVNALRGYLLSLVLYVPTMNDYE
jgi:hypothetical protein